METSLDRYDFETQQLTARRIPVAGALFLGILGLAHLLLWLDQPSHGSALAILYACYVAIVALQFAAARQPSRSVPATVIANIALALSIAIYYGQMGAETYLLVLGLGLFVVAAAVLYPLGMTAQIIVSAGVAICYPIALVLGASPGTHVNYDLLVLMTAIGVGLLAAFFLESQRRDGYQRMLELSREQRISLALLDIGRQLSAALIDPPLLAARLTESTRASLGADWAFLCRKQGNLPRLQPMACSRAPAIVADEILTVELCDLFGKEVDQRFSSANPIELDPSCAREPVRSLLLRWRISRLVLQPIRCRGELIAVLGCCYKHPGELSNAERRVLSGITHQAAIALDNARTLQSVQKS